MYSCSEAICLFRHRNILLCHSLLALFVISVFSIYSNKMHITFNIINYCLAGLMLILQEDFQPLSVTNMRHHVF